MAEEKRFLSNIPWFLQFIILMGLVGLVVFAVDFFLISGIRAETKANFDRLEQLKRENDANQIVLGNMAAFEQSLEDSKVELEQLKGLLPEEVQLSNIMHTIQARARSRGLMLRVFRPQGPIPRDYYTEKPIQIDVVGAYDKLGQFLADLANYDRINNVSKFQVLQTELQTEKVSISSAFTLTVYYVSPENLAALQTKGQAPAEEEEDAKGKGKSSKKSAKSKGKAKDQSKDKSKDKK